MQPIAKTIERNETPDEFITLRQTPSVTDVTVTRKMLWKTPFGKKQKTEETLEFPESEPIRWKPQPARAACSREDHGRIAIESIQRSLAIEIRGYELELV
jgi:hypothetical protein